MKQAPEGYDINQAYNDIIYLGTRLKCLEDLMDDTLYNILDTAIDFYMFKQEVSKFGGNWTHFIFHPDCDKEQYESILLKLKRLPPIAMKKELQAIQRDLKEYAETLDGNTGVLSKNIMPRLAELEKSLIKKGTNNKYIPYIVD